MIEAVAPIILLIGLGVVVAWRELLTSEGVGHVSNLTFRVFIPALLFHAMSHANLSALAWQVPLAYFSATVLLFLAYFFWQVWRGRSRQEAIVRSLGVTFPNTVMLGIPVVTVAYGQAGLTALLPILALNALIMLGGPSVLIEASAARSGRYSGLAGALLTVRRAVLHPFVLAILAGLLWSGLQLPLPASLDKALAMMSAAAPPICLVVLGASLADQFSAKSVSQALPESAIKLLIHPALVWVVGYFVVGLESVELAVVTVLGAIAAGANVVLFAHRYQVAIGQVSAVTASTTALGLLTLPVVLLLVRPN
ncbi:MAG: AEC family transporter [Burkholderiaceae bacterium]